MNLALRPAAAADREFAESVYFESQRWLIERLFGWRGDDLERTRFSQSYKEGQTAIVTIEGEAAGWLSVGRAPGAITVADLRSGEVAQSRHRDATAYEPHRRSRRGRHTASPEHRKDQSRRASLRAPRLSRDR
jgi:hypothetical protein